MTCCHRCDPFGALCDEQVTRPHSCLATVVTQRGPGNRHIISTPQTHPIPLVLVLAQATTQHTVRSCCSAAHPAPGATAQLLLALGSATFRSSPCWGLSGLLPHRRSKHPWQPHRRKAPSTRSSPCRRSHRSSSMCRSGRARRCKGTSAPSTHWTPTNPLPTCRTQSCACCPSM